MQATLLACVDLSYCFTANFLFSFLKGGYQVNEKKLYKKYIQSTQRACIKLSMY